MKAWVLGCGQSERFAVPELCAHAGIRSKNIKDPAVKTCDFGYVLVGPAAHVCVGVGIRC